jgi:hypothetical protein
VNLLPWCAFIAAGEDAGALQERTMAASSRKNRWSQHVTETSDALTLEPEVFRHDDPAAIARSLKESAETSGRRKSSPFRSAMSMLTFYINRAGKNLPEDRKRILSNAKIELRRLYGRSPR